VMVWAVSCCEGKVNARKVSTVQYRTVFKFISLAGGNLRVAMLVITGKFSTRGAESSR
jgi:hypothetical protein